MSVPTLGAEDLQDGAADFVAVPPDTAPRALRFLAVAAVCLGVAALAAATFVLSYSAIRAVALQAGVAPRLARGYPILLDAMLVIVLAAVLALRGAGLPSRLLAWATLLLVMTVAAGADAMHAAGRSLPHQAASITAAILPFVLVLIAFALLLAMLRHARLTRLADNADDVSAYGSAWALAQFAEPRPAVAPPTAAQPTAILPTATPPTATPPAAVPAALAGDDPPADRYDDDTEQADGGAAPEDFGVTLTEVTAASTEAGEAESPDDPDGPVFHRLFSAPTPEPPAED